MSDIMEQIGKLKIIPVCVIEDPNNAQPLAHALIEGGLNCAEVTFRTAAAAEAIKRLAKFNDLLLGAGTVLSVDQVKQAVDAGAQFIVAPGFNPRVVGYCVDNNIPVAPGVCTPTDIEAAMQFGLEILKFFPSETMGGLNTIKAIGAPYTNIKFIPTGGVNADNVKEYLASPKVHAVGGSWMVKKDLISSGNFEEIQTLTAEAVKLASEVSP